MHHKRLKALWIVTLNFSDLIQEQQLVPAHEIWTRLRQLKVAFNIFGDHQSYPAWRCVFKGSLIA